MIDYLLNTIGNYQIALAIGVFGTASSYYVILHKIGHDPYTRQQALHSLYDLLIGFITFLVITFIVFVNVGNYARFIVNTIYPSNIAKYLPEVSGNSLNDFQEVMSNVANIYYMLWSKTKDSLQSLYYTMVALQIVPVTAPIGIYLMQATQYFQWVSHTALFESYVLYILSQIAKYSILLSSLGAVLLVHDKTRGIGAFTVSMCICLCIGLYVFSSYVNYLINNVVFIEFKPKAVTELMTGAFNLASKLQEFCILSGVALAIIGACVGGLTYALSRVYQTLHV